ncbi:tetratricopeptide repeat protein [Neptunitalea lumnitzerae]|uniref:BatE protein n=1 Tax=Neptunitalea lumnitzerae TaxID=2965509 RepID=A0ABQ5MG20_9FLAO|nr:tetratricopeptide repeat protein [Neptunitalea sp. Y10]GLB48344.1 BatE protein [Neptunitalea sp. Y10]
MKNFVYILLLLITSLGFAQNNALFKEATDLYNSGKYEEAIQKYEAILNAGEESAALYFNLGNAHYKLSDIAPSIYYYEKALQLAPNDADIKNNRAFAQNMTVDAITPLPLTSWDKFKQNTVGALHFDAWAIIAVTLLIAFVVFISVYNLVYASWKKRLFFVLGCIMFIGSAVSVYFAELQYVKAKNSKYAIVFSAAADVNPEPNEGSNPIFTLHEGTKVKVLNDLNGWRRIALEDGKVGWLKKSAIKKL